ncbi:MAG: DUF11 domain-containing protein, partial [Propionibacteriaceae bacterium]|nr:DUF11 domain-containing protein [Propionibacteriaceae bacterium]
CTASYPLTQADIDAGQVDNTATVNGLSPTREPVTDTDTVATPIDQVPSLSLSKTADATSGLQAGDEISYTLVVTNTGNVSLAGVVVSDPMLGAVACPADPLLPGESMTCTATPYTVTTADVNRGRITNTATASASFCGNAGCVVVDSSASAVTTTKSTNSGGGGSSLAYTGFGGGTAALYGAGILLTGVLLLLVGRRRRKA